MLAILRRLRPSSDLSTVLSASAALSKLQHRQQDPQQGAWGALQQALLLSGQANQHRQLAVPAAFEVSCTRLNWYALGLGSRSYSTMRPRAVNALSQARSNTFEPVSLSSLTPGVRKYKRRRARGGGDKQAGRGHKGQKSRSG
jgi:hypothetical protein